MPAPGTNASSLRRHELGCLSFNSANLSDLVALINKRAAKGSDGFCIGYLNPHVYNLAAENTTLQNFINQCDLVCIDGLGTKLALNAQYRWSPSMPVHRVVALQLFDTLVTSLENKTSAVLIGVDKPAVQTSSRNINGLGAAFRIIATMDGFQKLEHYDEFLSSHANIPWVLIGAGTPKSEMIALHARQLCPQAIVFHMGAGSIKVYAGTKRRAAAWVSRYGLEWLHRMIFEPHTRARYTFGAWLFVSHLLHQKTTRNEP